MHTHTHKCIKLQMAASMEASMFSMFSMFNMHVRACVHACACMCMRACMGHPLTHSCRPPPPSIHPPPPRGDPRNQLKFDNTWTDRDISIPFEDLKSVKNSPPMGGCIVGGWVGAWVGWWVGSGQNTKNFKNVDWIKIIQFCLKIYHLLRHPHPWVGVWVVGWVSGSMGGVKSND